MYFTVILSCDHGMYSVLPDTIAMAPDNTTTDRDELPMQQHIKDLMVAPGGSADFGPTVV